MNIPTSLKAWLDKLYYYYGKQQCDYKLHTLWKQGDQTIAYGKPIEYSKAIMPLDINQSWKIRFNQRQILPNEIVWDLEDPSKIYETVQQISKFTKDYKVFFTGSKGYHIHAFFSRNLNADEKKAMCMIIGTDVQKGSENTMIALEYVPHWKTGRCKEEIVHV